MSGRELLLEIGCEEIPARFLNAALADLGQLIAQKLEASRISHGAIRTAGTPRRLIACVESTSLTQADEIVEKIGPPVKVAYDSSGKATKSAEAFAKSQGIDPSELIMVANEKGQYISARKKISGEPTALVLPDILARIILELPFPKSMRWGNLKIRFVRPIHWIVAVFGGEVIPLTVGDITSSDLSCGHRFMAPEAFKVTGFDQLLSELEKRFVLADVSRRRRKINEEISKLAGTVDGRIIQDAELLDHVTNLVEWPVPILSEIPHQFLSLPRDVVITPMRDHQKYFAIEDSTGQMLPWFIAVANTIPSDEKLVAWGMQRVLTARLIDAEFFFREDTKIPLSSFRPKLADIIYQKKLGSYLDKVERTEKLARWIAERVAPDATKDAARACHLSKADLVTQLVGEFPELQGAMGSLFAKISGEPESVAQAIFEHYQPRFAGDKLPTSAAGAVAAVAEKIDSICGFMAAGLGPTGAGDPYALRRQALGIINILLDRCWTLSLSELVSAGIDGLPEKLTASKQALAEEVMSFFKDRYKFMLTSKGIAPNIADAVLAVRFDIMPDVAARIEAVNSFASSPDFESFAIAFKRAMNIIRDTPKSQPIVSLFAEPQEKALFEAVRKVSDEIKRRTQAGEYVEVLRLLASIRPDVDSFFDHVLVMEQDPALRASRLGILHELSDLFSAVADFRRL